MLTVADVLAHDAWLSQRFKYDPILSQRDVEELLDEAARLAGQPREEPAAIFFAFSRHPVRLGEAWKDLPSVLAMTQARVVGLALGADREELRALRFAIAMDRLPFEEVRGWFGGRLRRL